MYNSIDLTLPWVIYLPNPTLSFSFNINLIGPSLKDSGLTCTKSGKQKQPNKVYTVNHPHPLDKSVCAEIPIVWMLDNNPSQRDSHSVRVLTNKLRFIVVLHQVCIVQKRDSGRLYAMKYVSRSACVGRGALGGVLKEVELLSSLEHPFLVNLWFSFQGT